MDMRIALVVVWFVGVSVAGPAYADFIFIPDEEEVTEVSEAAVVGVPAPAAVMDEPAGAFNAAPTALPIDDTAPAVPAATAQAVVEPPAAPLPPRDAQREPFGYESETALAAVTPAPTTNFDDVFLGGADETRGTDVVVGRWAEVPTAPTHRHVFDVRAGETVRTAFERWSESAGWTLIWHADFDLRIEANNVFFEDDLTLVVPQVLGGFRAPPGQRRLTATAYKGNRVLVIGGVK